MSPLQRLVVRLARIVFGAPPPVPPTRRHAPSPVDAMPAFIPDTNPLEDPSGPAELRTEHALMLMDPDVYGYLMLTVHRHEGSLRAEIRVTEQLDRSWWPAIQEALRRIAAVQRV